MSTASSSTDRTGAADSIDWLGLSRRCVVAQREIFAAFPDADTRNVYDGFGEGGDHTLVIDRLCEDVVFAELDALAAQGLSFTAISEERGTVRFGSSDSATVVVIDPIDGSLNARRTLPSHSLAIAVADGPSLDSVSFGFVHDFGAGEDFWARRGHGAFLGDHPIAVAPPGGEIFELVGLESAEPSRIAPIIEGLTGHCYRLRVVGSIAITLSWVAAGRLDAMIMARACRSVDAAAAALICREAGGQVGVEGIELAAASLGLDARYRVIAAATGDGLATLRAIQSASSAGSS